MFTAETISYSSFHTMSCADCSGDHSDWSQWLDQNAPQPLLPEASVNNCIAELRVHFDSRIIEVPDHEGRKSDHHKISRRASLVIRI